MVLQLWAGLLFIGLSQCGAPQRHHPPSTPRAIIKTHTCSYTLSKQHIIAKQYSDPLMLSNKRRLQWNRVNKDFSPCCESVLPILSPTKTVSALICFPGANMLRYVVCLLLRNLVTNWVYCLGRVSRGYSISAVSQGTQKEFWVTQTICVSLCKLTRLRPPLPVETPKSAEL